MQMEEVWVDRVSRTCRLVEGLGLLGADEGDRMY